MDTGKRKSDRNIRTIDSYFMTSLKKPKKDNPDSEVSETSTVISSENIQSNNCPVTVPNKPSTSKDKDSEKQQPKHQNDIGFHIGKCIDDFTKNILLENPWMPDDGYKYPYSLHPKGNGQMVKRYLSKDHIKKYNWLVYSDFKQGLFCKYCALFARETAGHNKGAKLQNLVTNALTKFKDLTSKDGYIETHNRNEYHKECITAAKHFLRTYHEPQTEVVNLLSSQRLRQVEENRARLRPIIESILFLGRQNISLRGHRDDGKLLSEQSEISNDGNFRALLNFRIQSGDKILESHLKNTSSRATYISKTTQNILINCCGEEVTSHLIEKIKKARYWSIIFDETTDLAHIEQIVVVVRYLDGNKARKDFIKFIDAYDSLHKNVESDGASEGEDQEPREYKLSGKNLADIVIKSLANLGLNFDHCIGIGTDGCSVMTSEKKGAVSEFQKVACYAKHVSCYNHALNNAISQSSKIQCIRNTVGVVKEVISFFKQSAKRNSILKSVVGKHLMSLCETRWVERHDSFILFSEGLPKIIKALVEISHWNDNNSAKSASIFINTLCTTEFIIALTSTIDILKITLPLRLILPQPKCLLECDMNSEIRIKNVAKRYQEVLPDGFSSITFEGELEMWKEKWQRESEDNLPADVLSTLVVCDKDLFPSIYELLRILLTLPVSAASAERSFSTLKRAKSWLRSKMGEERLNGLCLLHIHRDIVVDVDKIIERYAKIGDHRHQFVI